MPRRNNQAASTRIEARDWLERNARMHEPEADALARLAPALLAQLLKCARPCVSLGGPPGSGKSTLARLLAHLLSSSGRPAASLSLDDYYLGQLQREKLARSLHPLLRHRGVPGTHDWAGLLQDVDDLLIKHNGPSRLRVFDKSLDSTAPDSNWRVIDQPPEFLLLEGWCLGPAAQGDASLDRPVNELEERQDSSGVWRRFVNTRLAVYHRDLLGRVGQRWFLAAPDWDSVIDWRWRQEQELDQPFFRDRAAVASFLLSFERISRHAQSTAAQWADCVLDADHTHRLRLRTGRAKLSGLMSA